MERKGKKKKGKERKGKERKEKERKGKERKGKERKEKERKEKKRKRKERPLTMASSVHQRYFRPAVDTNGTTLYSALLKVPTLLRKHFCDLIWHNAYMTAIKCTKSTKLIEFQFRFLHQTLATNVSLVKMGYKDDIRCTFCHEEAENFTPLFWFCSEIELFWKHLIASLKDHNFIQRLSSKQSCRLGSEA